LTSWPFPLGCGIQTGTGSVLDTLSTYIQAPQAKKSNNKREFVTEKFFRSNAKDDVSYFPVGDGVVHSGP
jgi:hypothetical protein